MKYRRRKNEGRLLALLLTAAILLAAPDISMLAETATAAETKQWETATAAETEQWETATEETEQSETRKTAVEEAAEISTEDAEETVIKTDSTSPSNPVHHCTKQDDGTDYTDWSYVCFGSYPQSEVTGDALTSAITGAAYDSNGDAWVNGTKYRRISKSETNYSGYFGDSTYRYFKWERIKWRVLQNNGNTLFVVADQGLDCKDYNEEYKSITWENCTLRQWLNSDFYGTAFSSAEQGAIVEQTVMNEDNSSYHTEGGNNTSDKVYLLSIGEVTNPSYGFCESYSTYSASRRIQASAYANARGAWKSTNSGYEGNSYWWLRSPGDFTRDAAYVIFGGYVDRSGYRVNIIADAVVPALHIKLSSQLWSLTDDGASRAGGESENGKDTGTIVKTIKIKISAPSKRIAAGKKVQLTAKITPENVADSKVTWKSGNKKYATVNSKGVVIIKKAGKGKTVTITAVSTDGTNKKARVKIKIK